MMSYFQMTKENNKNRYASQKVQKFEKNRYISLLCV